MELCRQQDPVAPALIRVQHENGGVVAWTFGPRTDETCRELLALLTPFNTGMVTSHDWVNYAREMPENI